MTNEAPAGEAGGGPIADELPAELPADAVAAALLSGSFQTISIFRVEHAAGEPAFVLAYTNRTEFDRTRSTGSRSPAAVYGDAAGSQLADAFRRCLEVESPVVCESPIEQPSDWADRRVRIVPIVDADEVTHLVVMHLEDTARRRTLEAVFEAATDVSFIITEPTDDGTDAIICEFSPGAERMFGYDRDEIIGDSIASLHARGTGSWFADLQSRVDEGETIRLELDLKRHNGEVFPALVTLHPYQLEDRLLTLGVSIDITDRVRTQERLQAQRDNLKLLNEVVRHDIRNDLTVIAGYLDLLEGHLDGGEEYLDTIRDTTKRAVSLTETARDLADVLLHQGETAARVSLDDVLRTQVDELADAHPDAEVVIEGELPAADILADDMVDAIFRNLLQNAIEHNDKDRPRVEVSATADGDAVRVAIADNGPGIPDDRKESIFGRGEDGMTSASGGLGLYLVQTLVDRYDGRVWVEDNEPEGAVFLVSFPQHAREDS